MPAGGAAGQYTDLTDVIPVGAGSFLPFRLVNNAGGAGAIDLQAMMAYIQVSLDGEQPPAFCG